MQSQSVSRAGERVNSASFWGVCPVRALPAGVALIGGLSLVLVGGCASAGGAGVADRAAGMNAGSNLAAGSKSPAGAVAGNAGNAGAASEAGPAGGGGFRWTLERWAQAELGESTAGGEWQQRPEQPRRTLASASATSAESLAYADVADSLTQVTFTSAGNDFDPVVSRDGSTIVFASTQHRPAPDLYLARVGSRAVTQLTTDPASDAMPAISPDGRMIAFASDRSGTWQVYVMPAAGGRAVALTDDSAPAMHPTFSPDGARVAFSRLGQMTGRWELWVAQVATPAQAEFIGFGLRPAWCPVPGTGEMGSDRIAFQRARERGDRAFGLWTIDYKPGNVGSPVQIVAAETAAAINPAWSPDGKLIAYASVPVGGGRAGRSAGKSAELAGLWITTADGASRVNVSSGRDNALAPAWAATDRLFFVSSRAGREQVWSVGTQRAVAALPVGGAGEGAMKLTGGAAVGPAPVAGPIAAGAEAGPAAVPGAGGGAGGEAPAGARPAGGEPATVSVPTSEGPTREQGEPVATAPEIE